MEAVRIMSIIRTSLSIILILKLKINYNLFIQLQNGLKQSCFVRDSTEGSQP